MAQELEGKPRTHILPEFVVLDTVDQTVAGQVVKFSENKNGRFMELAPVCVRSELGGVWWKYKSAAFGIRSEIARKLSDKPDTYYVGKTLLFHFTGTEPTEKGSKRKLFKVLVLEEGEALALLKKAVDKEGSRVPDHGGVIAPMFPPRHTP